MTSIDTFINTVFTSIEKLTIPHWKTPLETLPFFNNIRKLIDKGITNFIITHDIGLDPFCRYSDDFFVIVCQIIAMLLFPEIKTVLYSVGGHHVLRNNFLRNLLHSLFPVKVLASLEGRLEISEFPIDMGRISIPFSSPLGILRYPDMPQFSTTIDISGDALLFNCGMVKPKLYCETIKSIFRSRAVVLRTIGLQTNVDSFAFNDEGNGIMKTMLEKTFYVTTYNCGKLIRLEDTRELQTVIDSKFVKDVSQHTPDFAFYVSLASSVSIRTTDTGLETDSLMRSLLKPMSVPEMKAFHLCFLHSLLENDFFQPHLTHTISIIEAISHDSSLTDLQTLLHHSPLFQVFRGDITFTITKEAFNFVIGKFRQLKGEHFGYSASEYDLNSYCSCIAQYIDSGSDEISSPLDDSLLRRKMTFQEIIDLSHR